ncbi:MAG: class I SAM-dependent methyltransferase [Anaerolineae bacterium]
MTHSAYDRLSRWYDLLAGRAEWQCVQAGLQELATGEGEVALEVGAGPGRALVALARQVGASGRAYGVDLSLQMCRIAQGRCTAAGLAWAQVLCGDAIHLPFPPECFDTMFMSFTLELFDQTKIPVVLNECRRVLRPNGRLGIVAMFRPEQVGLMLRLYEWLHEKLPNWVDCRPINPQEALADAGFAVLSARNMVLWGLPVAVVVARRK